MICPVCQMSVGHRPSCPRGVSPYAPAREIGMHVRRDWKLDVACVKHGSLTPESLRARLEEKSPPESAHLWDRYVVAIGEEVAREVAEVERRCVRCKLPTPPDDRLPAGLDYVTHAACAMKASLFRSTDFSEARVFSQAVALLMPTDGGER